MLSATYVGLSCVIAFISFEHMANPMLNNNFNRELIFYPTPITSHSFYNIGSLVGILLVIQVLSGVLLACFYIPCIDFAFNSVSYLMRSVNYG